MSLFRFKFVVYGEFEADEHAETEMEAFESICEKMTLSQIPTTPQNIVQGSLMCIDGKLQPKSYNVVH